MLVKLTSKKQITLPESVLSSFEGTEYSMSLLRTVV